MSKIPRMRLRSEDEVKLLKDFRAGKIPSPSNFVDECTKNGINPEKVTQYWYKGKHYSIFVKEKQISPEEFAVQLVERIKDHSPKYAKPKYTTPSDPHLLVIDPADIHIGKLAHHSVSGDTYDSSIAVKRVLEGVDGILNKSS